MANFNWVDYFIAAIFLISTLAGFGRGLVKEILSLATLVVAFVVAMLFSNQLAAAIITSTAVQSAVSHASVATSANASLPVSYAAIGISFALLFAGTILIGALITFLINLAFRAGVLGIGNRLLGAVFGLARGFVFNLALIFLVQLTSFSSADWWQHSFFVAQFQPAVIWVGEHVSPDLADLKAKFGASVENAG